MSVYSLCYLLPVNDSSCMWSNLSLLWNQDIGIDDGRNVMHCMQFRSRLEKRFTIQPMSIIA